MTSAPSIVDSAGSDQRGWWPGIATVYVPTDFSPLSWQVLPLAGYLAKRFGARLVPVHVDTTRPWQPEDAAAIRLRVTPFGRAVDVLVTADADPVRGLERTLARAPGSVLALSTHGRSGFGELTFGSVVEGLLRRIDAPMVAVGPGFDIGRHAFVRRVVAAVDVGATADALVADAVAWARLLEVPLELVHVRAPLYGDGRREPDDVARFEALAAEAAAEDPRVTAVVLPGVRRAREVVSHAAALRGTLLAMSSRARPATERMVVGSAVTAVLRHTPTGVLLLRRR